MFKFPLIGFPYISNGTWRFNTSSEICETSWVPVWAAKRSVNIGSCISISLPLLPPALVLAHSLLYIPSWPSTGRRIYDFHADSLPSEKKCSISYCHKVWPYKYLTPHWRTNAHLYQFTVIVHMTPNLTLKPHTHNPSVCAFPNTLSHPTFQNPSISTSHHIPPGPS